MTLFKRICAMLGAVALFSFGAAQAYDLDDPKDMLDAYIKTVSDLSGEETFTYAHSTVYAKRPDEKAQALFGLEVFGATRFIPTEGGYRQLHREIAFYTDLESGAVLEKWDNPLNGRTVKVYSIENDPVNWNMMVDQTKSPARIHYMSIGDHVVFYREVMLLYPSALPRADYPLNSQADMYEAGEMFNNFVLKSDLDDPDLTAAPSTGSWSRFGPWLPWMEMADAPGNLVYHGQSVKLSSLDEAPDWLVAAIEAVDPKYLSAPEEDYGPNETSWTVFKKIIDAERAQAD